ncbi:MAG: DUF4389 domain-containing protein [Solirubrobacterales bacterium]
MYPVRYEADYSETQNRWKAFFRLILAIPWYIVLQVYLLAAFVVAFLAWFAILFTGRYPEGLYNFNAGVLRFTARANAFFYLQTEEYPSFGFEANPGYPIRAQIDPPLQSYNRWKAGFRLILAFPVYFMAYLIPGISGMASAIAWFHIVFMGRTSGGAHNALTFGLVYQLRSLAYLLLMTERIPPVSDQAPAPNLEPGASAVTGAATARTA